MKTFLKRLFRVSVILGFLASLLAFVARYASGGIVIWISFFQFDIFAGNRGKSPIAGNRLPDKGKEMDNVTFDSPVLASR